MLFQTTFKILNDVFFTIKTLRTDQRTFLKQCDESFFYTNINLQKKSNNTTSFSKVYS